MSVSSRGMSIIKWAAKPDKKKKAKAVKATSSVKPKKLAVEIKADMIANQKAKRRLKDIKKRHKI